MEQILIDLTKLENIILIIICSLLIAAIILLYNLFKLDYGAKIYHLTLRKYNQLQNIIYKLNLKLRANIDRHGIHASKNIRWALHKDRLIDANIPYSNLVDNKGILDIIKKNIQIIKLSEIAAISSFPSKIKVIVNGKKYSFRIDRLKESPVQVYELIDLTSDEANTDLMRKQNDSHLQIMNQLTNPVSIFGQDGKLIFFNSAFEKFSNIEITFLRNEPTESQILDLFRRDSLIPSQVNYKDWKKKQLDIYKSLDNREQWWHLQDGQSIRVLSQPNPVGGVTHIFENHTERITLENEYRMLTDIQKQTLDNLSEGIALFGTDAKIKLMNPKFQSLWNLSESNIKIGMHIESIIDMLAKNKKKVKLFHDLYNNIISSGSIRKDQEGTIKISKEKIIFYKGSILPDASILYTFIDITDSHKIGEALKEKNLALIDADRIKTIFMNNVSYELRAPLTNIIGFSEMIEDKKKNISNKERSEYISIVKKSGQELHQLINEILDLTALESQQIPLKYEKVDVEYFRNLIIKKIGEAYKSIIKIDLNCNKHDQSLIIDVTYTTSIFSRMVIHLYRKYEIKDFSITINTSKDDKCYLFTFNGSENNKIENNISPLNKNEYVYSQDDIGLIIIQKYAEYLNGSIKLDDISNKIILQLPKINNDKL
tara:strand:- start:8598 stop:10565 length:1968 start_codon:yes stop_codon:yes gene_type:complete